MTIRGECLSLIQRTAGLKDRLGIRTVPSQQEVCSCFACRRNLVQMVLAFREAHQEGTLFQKALVVSIGSGLRMYISDWRPVIRSRESTEALHLRTREVHRHCTRAQGPSNGFRAVMMHSASSTFVALWRTWVFQQRWCLPAAASTLQLEATDRARMSRAIP